MTLRSRTLVLAGGIALVAALVAAAALVLARGERDSDSVSSGVERTGRAVAPSVELIASSEPAPTAAHESERRAQSAASVVGAAEDAVWVSGRVVPVDGAVVPADEEAFVTTRPGEERAPVSADGTFRLPLERDERFVRLQLDARYLYLERSVRLDLDELEEPVELRAELGARIAAHLNATPETAADFAGAKVVIRGRPRAGSMEQTTFEERSTIVEDPRLRFDFGGLPPSLVYELECDVDGWAVSRREALVVRTGETLSLGLWFVRGAQVHGRAVGARGEPLLGAEIVVRERRAATDAAGEFVLRAVTPGPAKVVATIAGAPPAELDLGTLADGDERTDVVLVVGGDPAIVGVVRWPDGTPALQADVEVETAQVAAFEKRVTIKAVVDETGAFRVGGLPAGTYHVRASARPPSANEDSPAWTASATSAPPSPELVLTLDPGGVVRGRVVDDAGAPIERFTITATPAAGEPVARKFRDENGAFELAGLAGGAWLVSVRAPLYVDPPPVDVSLAEKVDLELVCTRTATVAGRVVDGAGAPIRGVTVTCASLDRERMRSAWSDSTNKRGEFKVGGVSARVVRVSAEGAGYAPSGVVELLVEPGDERTGVEIVVAKGGAIEGTIVDESGEPAYGSTVWVRGIDVEHRSAAFADGKGRFQLDSLAPGRYGLVADRAHAVATVVAGETTRVRIGGDARIEIDGRITGGGERLAKAKLRFERVDGLDMRMYETAVTDADGRYATRVLGEGDYVMIIYYGGSAFSRVEHVPAVDAHTLDVDLAFGALAGTVRDGHGAPVAGALVTIAGDPLVVAWSTQTSTDASGAWSVGAIRAGTYEVLVRCGGASARVDVRAGSTQNVDLVTGDDVTVLGRVVDERGNPVAGATVVLRLPDGAPLPLSETTDATGSFDWDGLSSGRHTVLATQGSHCGSARFMAPESGVALVEVVLARGTMLRIHCRDAAGEDVPALAQVVDATGTDCTLGLPPVLYHPRPRLGPVPSGTYVVRARDDAGRTAERTVATTADRIELDVELVFE